MTSSDYILAILIELLVLLVVIACLLDAQREAYSLRVTLAKSNFGWPPIDPSTLPATPLPPLSRPCNYCGKPIISENRKVRLCSAECRESAKQKAKRDWWNRNRSIAAIREGK
jgi:predicted nucleic acid-binding Zn ribbon protein